MSTLMPANAHSFSMTMVAAVNNSNVLANCLERSPDIAEGRLTLKTYRGFPSASIAYNLALDETNTDIVVFVHQDVYLPAGTMGRLQNILTALSAQDPQWAVAGVIGIDAKGREHGQTWCTANGRLLGFPVNTPTEIVTLDEILLVVRRAAGVRFDAVMPSFHLYAADIVQIAAAGGMKSYVLPLPIVHHSRPIVGFDATYRAAYRYMQRKWRAVLPLPNLCCPIHRSSFFLIKQDLRLRWLNRGRARPPEPKDNPAMIAKRLGMESGG